MRRCQSNDQCAGNRDRVRGLAALWRDERGVAMIEYALISALIALAIVASLSSLGRANANNFNSVGAHLAAGAHGHGRGGGNSGNGRGNGGPVGP